MTDKVMAIVRATLLHENTVKEVSISPGSGDVHLSLLQPNDRFQYPDYRLVLTFSAVRSFAIEDVRGEEDRGVTVLGIECTAEQGVYKVEFLVGDMGVVRWVMRLVFVESRYQRSPSYP
ncbi:MAG: hypothetical protein JWN86_2376 [Planctomycetota bacterium]|nr:hypothetical protein [Planctomycetota bacterium]